MDSARPPRCGKSIEPNIPKPRTATTSSVRFALNGFMATSVSGLKQCGQFLDAVGSRLDLDQLSGEL
jgi:hypothetical protein